MAAVDYFLKIDGVDGESLNKKHPGSIEIDSFSWGATNAGSSGTGGGGGSGKVDMQDFHFVMKVNKASPTLMLFCANGKHIKNATLSLHKAGGNQEEYYTIKFEDLIISSYQTGGSGHGETVPTDQCSFNFAKIHYDYRPQKADGSLDSAATAGWDLKAGAKL